MKYKISVIIPTYNRAHIISDALDSVLMQTYSNWECLIIDDGSTDHTEKIMMDYINVDQRFNFIKRPSSRKKGAATCRNIGLENATGDYIQFLDSDDYIATNKFEVQIKLLKNENSTTIGTCRYGIMKPIWEKPKILYGYSTFKTFKNPQDLFKTFAIKFSYFPLHVYLIPSVIIEKAGRWNENLTVNDDGEYFSRVILNCSKIKFCNDTFVVYRKGAGNRLTSKTMEEEGFQSFMDSWNLIENNIFQQTGIKNHNYVQGAKTNMFHRLQNENPDLLKKYLKFFESKWTYPIYLMISIVNRIRTRLLVSSKTF